MGVEDEIRHVICEWYRDARAAGPSRPDAMIAIGIAIGVALAQCPTDLATPHDRDATDATSTCRWARRLAADVADELHYVAQGLAHGRPGASREMTADLLVAILDARDQWIAAWVADVSDTE